MKIRRAVTGELIFEKAKIADTFSNRLKGLMWMKGLYKGECLVISPCSSIHTFFMKFDIDVAFLDRDYRVLKISKRLQPGKMIMPVKRARYVVESDSKFSHMSGLDVGDVLEIVDE